jgi:hypothetical protein
MPLAMWQGQVHDYAGLWIDTWQGSSWAPGLTSSGGVPNGQHMCTAEPHATLVSCLTQTRMHHEACDTEKWVDMGGVWQRARKRPVMIGGGLDAAIEVDYFVSLALGFEDED